MLMPCTVKVARVIKARVKASSKVTETKVRASSQSSNDSLTGIASSVVSTDTRNQTAQVRANPSMARVTNVEHMGTRELIVLLKRWHIWNSESVAEPNEEPAEIESLEWLCALEHDGEEAMASLTDAPVRLLLDSGSGVSACSLGFAPHVKTLIESSVRARAATGHVTKSLGKKTVDFDINGIATGANMEVLKRSKPILSAGKMVQSGRKIVLDEHNFHKKTVKRIPLELTRGDVFEIIAYMSSKPRGLPKKPVLICPNEVVEAEDPGHAELDESMPEPDAAPRGVAVPETPSAKDREAHEQTHLPMQPWCSVCVQAHGVDELHLPRPAGERAEAQGVDHMPVIQFDYAYMSAANAKGEQVRMRTILDTSTGYGTACVIDVKGGGDKCAISSAVSLLKELVYTRFRCRTDPEPAIKALRVWVLRRAGTHIRALRLDVEERLGSVVGVTHQCVPWLGRHATLLLAAEQVSAETEWCDRV